MIEIISSDSPPANDGIIKKPLADPAQDKTHIKHKSGNLGLTLIGLGVLFCISGFVLMFNSSFGSLQFNLSLYGLTGAGGSSIMGGLFLLLG